MFITAIIGAAIVILTVFYAVILLFIACIIDQHKWEHEHSYDDENHDENSDGNS